MAKHVRMTDGAHHIVVVDARVDFMKEKGFTVEGDAHLAPGQLVGHIRVRRPARPPAPGLVRHEVEMTDGFQVIRSDKNYEEQHAKFVRKGFLELPPMPLQPDVSGLEDVEEITRVMTEWSESDDVRHIKYKRAEITKKAAQNGRYARKSQPR